MQEVIDENKEAEPTIIPHNIEKFKIRFGKISVGKREIIEADGSRRKITPMEARLRKISYSAPIQLEISTYINDVQRESFVSQIGKIPIMLKSKYCHLYGLSKEELVKAGEDPYDPGGYFIVNGTEKVIVTVEDLAPNNVLIEKSADGYVGRIFSTRGSYKIPHQIEQKKDGIFYISFTRARVVPLVVVIKALGLTQDENIVNAVSKERLYDALLLNLYEFVDVKTQADAIDYLARKAGLTQPREIRIERMKEIIDRYLLPNIGLDQHSRLEKAYSLCKMLKRYIDVVEGRREEDDKDHYGNKRMRLGGDLLMDLFRVNFKVLVNDILYNFQRIIKRGKLPSIKVIIREKLLTQRIYSSMATGEWVGARQGIAQRMERGNFLATLSHLQRVVSPLSSAQENFEARELHCTHIGRLCPIETPEGTNIGLRKNFSLLCSVSQETPEKEIEEKLFSLGVKRP
jgi:DNA-directed RNA polymerase subunit B